jgi:sirohydrochlorin ferrochelatase
MESFARRLSERLGSSDALSEAEVDELAIALQELADEGTPVPEHLVRHEYVIEGSDIRHYRSAGRALDVVPDALERLGDERERVVAGLIRWYEQAVRDYRQRVTISMTEAEELILVRPLNVAVLFKAAKPKTEESALQVAGFLRSEFDQVCITAAEMLMTHRIFRWWPTGCSSASLPVAGPTTHKRVPWPRLPKSPKSASAYSAACTPKTRICVTRLFSRLGT